MKKLIAMLIATIMVCSCMTLMSFNASAVEEFKPSKEFMALMNGKCPYCENDISKELENCNNFNDVVNIKIICSKCSKAIDCGTLLINELNVATKQSFPNYKAEDIEKIVDIIIGKCPECKSNLLDKGQTLMVGDSKPDASKGEVSFDSLACKHCDFKGINNPKLKEDVNIVGENLMIGVLKAGLGEKADIIDKNMEKLYASATKANVEIISNKEAATVTGISKKFSKTDFVFSRTRVNDKQIVSFYKTVTITNEDGTTDIKTDINSKDNFFFKVTFEDYTKLEENQFDIDKVLMVQNKDDSCTLYYVYNDDTQDDPITTEEDIPSTTQPQTTLVDDIVQPSTDTEDGVISGNPETGNKMLMPGIVAISLLSLSALAVVFLRRKETN